MDVIGNYHLVVKFGNTIVPIQSSLIEELTITQDIDRLLPTFKMVLKDATGLLCDVIPFDRDLNNISIEIARNVGADKLNEFNFIVDRREVISNREYAIQGTLNVEGLLDPSRIRTLSGNVKTNLEEISDSELGIVDTEIGVSLSYDKKLVQPNWTNAQLFRYLKANLIGKNNEAGYRCFIKNTVGKQVLVFKSINELVSSQDIRYFMVGYRQHENFYPVFEYRVFDNSQIIGNFGTKIQRYKYFDYSTGSWMNGSVNIEDYPSLVEQHLVENDSSIGGVSIFEGRSNDFSSNFKGRIKNNYYDRLTGMINMWIATWGIENIVPGDLTKVAFSEALEGSQMFLFQHSGYWMVKRVVHIIGSSFMSNILLTRSGIDTSIENTLLNAEHFKR